MEEGKIPDEAITASSSYEMKSVGPQNARYTTFTRDNAYNKFKYSRNTVQIFVEYGRKRMAVLGVQKLKLVAPYENIWRSI